MSTLVTLDDYKTYQGITDTKRDVTLQGVIDSVEAEVIKYTSRDLVKDPANDSDPELARTVAYKLGEPYIDLFPFEARSISAVVIDPAGTNPQTLTSDQWILEPIANRNGVYDRVTLRSAQGLWQTYGPGGGFPNASGYPTPPYPYGNYRGFQRLPVSITGRWGWPAVPAFVKDWIYEMVEDRFVEDIAAFADVDGDVLTKPNQLAQAGGPTSIPFRIRAAMDAFKRSYIGSV